MNINSTRVYTDTPIRYIDNPKRVGKKSWLRYEMYQHCETIGEYLSITDKKYSKPDLRYDLMKGFLIIEDDDVIEGEYEVLQLTDQS